MDKLKKIIKKSLFPLFSVCFFFLFSCEESDIFSYREGIQEDAAVQKIATDFALDGKWKDSSTGFTLTVSGSSATIFVLGTGNWKTASDLKYVKLGDQKWRSISKVSSIQWNYQDLWLKTTNNVISGIAWSASGTLTMNADGQTITATSVGPVSGSTGSVIYTRVN